MQADATLDGAVILVVDDDPIIRKIVLRSLEPLGCGAVLEADDGLAARALLEERAVDVVITDVVMPGMDGLDLIRWANDHRPEPAWIILSGIDSFDNAVEAVRLGAVDFLPKPLHVEKLRLAVRNVLRHAALARERERLSHELGATNAQLAARVEQLEDVCRLLEQQAQLIDRDLAQAEVIQRALLPARPPRLEGFRVDTFYRSGHHVGGDLFDTIPIDAHRAVIVVADACGHGVTAAMLSVLFKLYLRTHVRRRTDGPDGPVLGEPLRPAQALAAINRALQGDLPTPGLFVTAAYALLDTRASTLSFASAGHPPMLWVRADGTERTLTRSGPALGLYGDAHFGETTLELARGDRLLLYTDGFEAAGGSDAGALAACIRDALRTPDPDPHAVLLRLFREGQAAAGAADPAACAPADAPAPGAARGERDDVTMLLLSACAGDGRFDAAIEREPGGARRPAARAGSSAPTLEWGETPQASCLVIAGRATWTDAADLFDAALGVIDRGRALSIDLSGCDYLDSTVLGTLHEIVMRADAAGVPLRLQGVGPRLLPLFEELDMEAVLEHTVDTPLPLPGDRAPLGRCGADLARRQQRVLHAHETLASISAANRDELASVLDALRAELRAPS